jgi:ribonuclease Z
MQNFELTILGCSSATPTSSRNPTAQLVNLAERFFLIDCGEGTQMQIRRYRIKFQRISHIFISHLHGDHYLGLPGLLSSMHLLGRTNDMHIYCPAELQEILEVQFRHSQTWLNYKIIYHHHNYVNGEVLFEDEKAIVKAVVLNHRIPCCGFLFVEKPQLPNISVEMLRKYRIPVSQIMGIKAGADFIAEDGRVVPNEELVDRKLPQRSYAYCSDTKYDESILEVISGATLLYHEATFMKDMAERAKETYHSTALQAGQMALKAGVKLLMIGHYSARYKEIEPLAEEARTVFPQTILAVEGEKTRIPYA